MNSSSKMMGQIVVLVILLVGLGFSGYRMYRLFSPVPPGPAATAAAARTGAGAPATTAAPPASTPVASAPGAAPSGAPPAGSPAAGQAKAGAAPPAPATTTLFPMLPDGQVNPDMFRVYALQPPKNPFMQDEAWFKNDFEQIPGYPELRDKNYFETMEPGFPDVGELFGQDIDWKSVTLRKTDQDRYSVEGTSKDGRIQTTVEAVENLPETRSEYMWTKGSGVPLNKLSDPDYVREHAGELKGGLPSESAADGAAPEDGGAGGLGLAIPGGEGQPSDATSPALPGGGQGDALVCAGVNVKNGRSSALMYFNNSPYLVTLGSVIPTHYQVLEIKKDGVVMLELRDGSSVWVPISGTPAPDKK